MNFLNPFNYLKDVYAAPQPMTSYIVLNKTTEANNLKNTYKYSAYH